MNCFQMAWRSCWRKPVKSLLLLLVVCVVSVFLLSGMASKNASIATQDKTRQAIGAGLLLEGNEANRRQRINKISEEIGQETEGSLNGVHQKKIESSYGTAWQVWTDNSFETLKIDDIKKIANVTGITDYNITTAVTAVNPMNFSRIEDPDVDQSSDILGVTLIGNRDMEMDSNVLSGNVSLKTGRMVTRDDSDVCVISEELAEKNNLTVGDQLQFNDYHDKKASTVYEAKIIGVYRVKQKMTPYMSGDTYRSENVIFTDLRFPEKAEGSKDDPLFEKAYFKVQDVDKYDDVKEAVKKADIDWQRYDLIDNDGNLDIMASNFNDLQNISQILIWVVAGASFMILFLVFVFWLKNRVQEVGIFLSLGISKFRILSQILLEAVMIAVIAISISFAISPGVSDITANYLVSQQIRQAEEDEILNSGKVAADYQKSEQTVTKVNADITTEMMFLDGTGVIALITLSVLIAGTSIIKRNPKDILSEMS